MVCTTDDTYGDPLARVRESDFGSTPSRPRVYATEGVLVARDAVMECQVAREHRRDDEQTHEHRCPRSEVLLSRGKDVLCGVATLEGRKGSLNGVARPVADDEHPPSESEEEGDEADRDESCPPDGLLRVSGLLSVKCGGLKAEHRREGEDERHRDASSREIPYAPHLTRGEPLAGAAREKDGE